ncbi:MAG: hypothetical protein K9L22_00400 [Methylococcaceae bacterium]|nr:hypothetical protein [Methylococcaceae bacterium]
MQFIKSNYRVVTAVLILINLTACNTEDKFKDVTYNQDIAAIINEKCVICHRAGEVGPMPLQTYEQIAAFATPIEFAVQSRRMPPWHADASVGKFANDRSLNDEQYKKVLSWIEQGYPEGTGKAPALKTYTDGWQIGKPDIEFTIPEPVTIPETGEIDYQYQIVPTNFTEDRWIIAAEVRPEQRGHAHHVTVSVLPNDEQVPPATEMGIHCPQFALSQQAEKHNEELRREGHSTAHIDGEFLVGWGVGIQFIKLPEGAAIRIPAGSKLVFQLHYVTNGVATVDASTKIGLTFADKKITKQVHTLKISNQQFVIPPHAKQHEAIACYTLTNPVTLVDLMPHMHLRGKDFRYSVTLPDGEVKQLLYVPHYDFEWQTIYRLAEPLALPAGSKLNVLAHFDNSAGNPHNPNPEQEVYFGEQTDDEMLLGYAVVMSDLSNP